MEELKTGALAFMLVFGCILGFLGAMPFHNKVNAAREKQLMEHGSADAYKRRNYDEVGRFVISHVTLFHGNPTALRMDTATGESWVLLPGGTNGIYWGRAREWDGYAW